MVAHTCASCGGQCDGSGITQSEGAGKAMDRLVKKVKAHTRAGKDVKAHMRGGEGPGHRKTAAKLQEYLDGANSLPGARPQGRIHKPRINREYG